MHLVIWDGFAQLAADPALQAADFVGRVTALAQHGPAYGVAQLVIADPVQLHTETATDVETTDRLRALLSDNVIALRINERIEHQLGGYMIAPTKLPREHGHALVLVAETHHRRDIVHTHLDLGRSRSDCEPCRRAATAPLGQGEASDPAEDPYLRGGVTR